MKYSPAEVMQFIKDNDIRFVRLAFCDVLGEQKSISIMPKELERVFERGASFDAAAITGFGDEYKSDLVLRPDTDTLAVLPFSEHFDRTARMFCSITRPDGEPYELDFRRLLGAVDAELKSEGISCRIGAECEFYLFRADENGDSTGVPIDYAGYMDITPKDRGVKVRHDICAALESMGIIPESGHHEEGPGQNEIDFRCDEPLRAADDLITFKEIVCSAAAQSGMFATLEAKPLLSSCGNGMHINLLPVKDGKHDRAVADSFMAGVLLRVREITAFLNSTRDSYKRLGSFKAPKYVAWSPENRSQLIRIPGASSGSDFRMELRSPDPMANPYIAYSLILKAGLEGVKRRLTPPEPQNMNLFTAPPELLARLERLPESFDEAIKTARESEFVRSVLPASVIETYAQREDR